MGCDIHLYCEKYNEKDKKWISADRLKLNEYYGKYEDENQYSIVHLYDDRNYALFGVLAGVRNYYDNECISEPKGLPDDICEFVKNEAEYWDGDGHSHSYFTAKELFDWQKEHSTTNYSGMISPENQLKLDKEGITPTSWCQWTNQENWKYREWTEPNCVLDHLIKKVKDRMEEEFWIFKDEDYEKYAENFRIVFWFDN